MPADSYYALTALPVLDGPGTPPPLTLAEFLTRIPEGPPTLLARAVLLGEDLLQRESLQAGELESAEPAVLTAAQLAGEEPLPAELAPEVRDGQAHALPVDALWEAFYAGAAALGRRLRSSFLLEWVGTEVRLRNDLARARAVALGLQPAPYLVATALESDAAAVQPAFMAWQEAPDPLTGLQGLLAARWRWIELQEPLFTFDTDEYPAYAAKLALLHRWQRSAVEQPSRNWSGGVAR